MFRKVKLGLQEHNRSHFFDHKFISINIFSTELSRLYWLKGFEGISSLTNSIIPPPKPFLSSRNETLKPSIGSKDKDRSTYVSETSKISNLSRRISRTISNLFLKDFKFK